MDNFCVRKQFFYFSFFTFHFFLYLCPVNIV